MAPRKREHKTPPEQSELGLERIVFFSDAVMAIAITILVIDLKLPEVSAPATASELSARLRELTPRFISFFISFVVVGVYWTSHHRYFRYIKRYDGVLIFLNLMFLMFIALMPFFTGMLNQYGTLPLAVAAYALSVAAIGLSIGSLWWYASYRHRLVDEKLDESFIHSRNLISIVMPLIFLISVPFAWRNPYWSMTIWWVGALVAVGVLRLWNRFRRKA
jgi:TMEM175 potassium channel family protein